MRFATFVRLLPWLLFGVASTPVYAAGAGDCGTIIVPPGVGIGPGSDITSFNPLLVDSEYNAEAAYLLFMQLLQVNRFHQIDFSRSIASAVSTPDQGKTYLVTLRSWHWSDGVPVTASDVAYTFGLIKQLGPTFPGYQLGGIPDIIASLTINDPSHFTIVLKRRVNADWFILNGLEQLLPLPAHVWGRYSLDDIEHLQSTPAFFQVVDGPLVVKRLTVGISAEFAPNPHWEGQSLHFQRFIMKFMDSEGAELQAMEAHDLDVSNLPFALWNAAQHIPGVHVVTLPASYSWHQLLVNLNNPTTGFFRDVRVRDAIADAINQPEMIGLAMHGQGDPVYGPVPPEPATFLSPAAQAGHYPVGYDPAKARALLAQAGFTPGPDGIMQRDGQPLSFTLMIPAGQPMRILIAESAQQDLRAVGIRMLVHQVEFNQMMVLGVGQPAGWQAMLFASDVSAFPTGEDNFGTTGFYNWGKYASPEMDRLIADSTNKPGLDALFTFEDYASAEQPVIFLPVEKYSVLVRNGLNGVDSFMNPLGYWFPEQLSCTAGLS